MNSTIWIRGVLAVLLFLPPFASAAQDARPTHPLDALTAAEIHQVKELLKADGKLGPKARFHAVDLEEPAKAAVIAWRLGTALPRRAIAVVSEAGTVHEATVDLSAGRVTAWQAVTGEPALLLEEIMGATSLVVSAPDGNQNNSPVGVIQPRTGRFLKPQPLDRSSLAIKPGDDPRGAWARRVADP